MLDRIAEAIWSMVTSVPAWLAPEGSPTFFAVRAMFGLIFIVLVVYLIAMHPFRSAIASVTRKTIGLFHGDCTLLRAPIVVRRRHFWHPRKKPRYSILVDDFQCHFDI